MGFYSIWPFFVCIVIVMLTAASPIFSAVKAPTHAMGGRVTTLDGLRGFLALAVYFHHLAIYNNYLRGDGWGLPPSQFYTMLGQIGVSLFFMITGFLFWGRMIRERGHPDWTKLYVARVFRIWPVYLVAVLVMMIIVFSREGLHLRVPLITLSEQLARWIFFAVDQNDLNGYKGADMLLASVYWTLHFEWLFYLSLPIAAIAARKKWTHLPFVMVGLIVCFALYFHTGSVKVIFAALFFAGMITASLRDRKLIPNIPNTAASIAALALIASTLLLHTAYCPAAVLLLGPAFYLIASGCTLFGLLNLRAAHRLGDISYGIYLLQGLVLALMFSLAPLRSIAVASPLGHWATGLLGAVLLMLFALAVHVAVERPAIEIGQQLTKRPIRLVVDPVLELP